MKRALKVLFFAGRIFSPLYGVIMVLRAWLYRKNFLLRPESLPVPVISVGNLTLGGTGKTPMVLYVSRFILGLGRKPAIVSRGYGGRSAGDVGVVSDGRGLRLSPDVAGDEPVMLAGSVPEAVVLVAPRRIQACRKAVGEFGADVIVMDDGFQHLAVRRDLDLVLFGAGTFLGSGWVFPGGELREPFSALKRAHAFVITGVDGDNRAEVEAFKRLLKWVFPEKPVFCGEYLPVSLLHSKENKVVPMDKARKVPLLAFAGIANPEAFRRTLARERFLITGFRAFADHHRYSGEDVAALVEAARARKARALITTEKDFVKLRSFATEIPILALKIELLMDEGFDLFLASALGAKKRGAAP